MAFLFPCLCCELVSVREKELHKNLSTVVFKAEMIPVGFTVISDVRYRLYCACVVNLLSRQPGADYSRDVLSMIADGSTSESTLLPF